MSSIIYYSNFCEKSKRLLQVLAKSACSKDIHFLCIDKREKSQDGITHLILENGDKILLPPQVIWPWFWLQTEFHLPVSVTL